MNDSNKPPGNSTYKALLVNASRRACSTANCTVPSENLDWVIHPNANYVRADGKTPLFTSNSAGIFVLSGIGAPTFTNSVAETVASVWTGLGTDWRTANACSDWTDGTSSFTGMVGDTSKFNSDAISTATAYNCDFQLSFLCVEQ